MTVDHARTLRRTMTDAERALWARIRNRQLHALRFRRQAPIGPYIVDFACFRPRIAIEIDGGHHANSDRDAARDAWLAARGFVVVRYWNNEVLGAIEGVLADLVARLARHPALPREEGGR